jgi:hypothetical protein
MLVDRCVSARVCVCALCVCLCVPLDGAGRAAHCAGAGEPAPRGGLAQTVMSLAPGAARRPPGDLDIYRSRPAADHRMICQPPTGDGRSTLHSTLLAMCGADDCLITVEKDRVTLSCAPRLSVTVCSFSPSIYAQARRMFLDA